MWTAPYTLTWSSLIPSPPLFLPSVCVHFLHRSNQNQQWGDIPLMWHAVFLVVSSLAAILCCWVELWNENSFSLLNMMIASLALPGWLSAFPECSQAFKPSFARWKMSVLWQRYVLYKHWWFYKGAWGGHPLSPARLPKLCSRVCCSVIINALFLQLWVNKFSSKASRESNLS